MSLSVPVFPMSLTLRVLHVLPILLAGLFGAPPASGATGPIDVGAAKLVVAQVSADDGEKSRPLSVDDAVRFREVLKTAAESAAVIALTDGTELAMGERALVTLDEFVLGEGLSQKLGLTLRLGALRFATGNLPKPAYQIRTPSASLSVRGTIFDLAVGEDGAAYLAVREGAVTVATSSGQNIDVLAGQSLSVDAAGQADLPRPTPPAPIGTLAAKLAAMDETLAEQLAGSDLPGLGDLDVLGPSRTLAGDGGLPDGIGPDGNRPGGLGPDKPGPDKLGPDKPSRPDRDKRAGDKDRPGNR